MSGIGASKTNAFATQSIQPTLPSPSKRKTASSPNFPETLPSKRKSFYSPDFLATPVTPSPKKFHFGSGEPHVITSILRLLDDLNTSDTSALPVSKVPIPKTHTLASNRAVRTRTLLAKAKAKQYKVIATPSKTRKVQRIYPAEKVKPLNTVVNGIDTSDESHKIIDLEPEVVDDVASPCGNAKEGIDDEMPDFIASNSDTIEIEESTSAQQISTVGTLDWRKNKKVPVVNSNDKGNE
ncbi:hypothetical protein C0992_004785 [Termitomyces sp. T32_za158]|nr:hypothetical protein C0992_004785 [Termitomyces sp. T32_za158]